MTNCTSTELVAEGVPNCGNADDLNEEELKFFAVPSGSGRAHEFQGLYKLQGTHTGNHILLFTNVPKGLCGRLKLYASIYDPLQLRSCSSRSSGLLDLEVLDDPRDWEEIFALLEADGEATIVEPIMDSIHVELPKESPGLLSKARALMGL